MVVSSSVVFAGEELLSGLAALASRPNPEDFGASEAAAVVFPGVGCDLPKRKDADGAVDVAES